MYWVNTMAQKMSCIKPMQKFVPAHFALIIIIVVHVLKKPGFLKVIIIVAVHVAS